MAEIQRLLSAIGSLRGELPALIGPGWPGFDTELQELINQLSKDPDRFASRILALFRRHPPAFRRLAELLAGPERPRAESEAQRSGRSSPTRPRSVRPPKMHSTRYGGCGGCGGCAGCSGCIPGGGGSGPSWSSLGQTKSYGLRATSPAPASRAAKARRAKSRPPASRQPKPRRAFRMGRNRQTGEVIKITASKRPPHLESFVGAKPRRPPASRVRSAGKIPDAPPAQAPRWILAKVFDVSAGRDEPTPAFRAGGTHEIQVIIGAAQRDWLTARGRDASESIDSMLPKGTHELTIVFFVPALRLQKRGKLTLPPTGPTPKPAKFRFKARAAGTAIEALISIVHRGRVLQTALLSGKAVADPRRAPRSARITLRLQVVVPGFADLDRREPFDAALVTATGADDAAVAAGIVQAKDSSHQTVLFAEPRIDKASQAIRGVLEAAVTDESIKSKLDTKAARELLWKLAQQGRLLYEHIGERLERELPGHDLSRIQLVQSDPEVFIPIEFAYALPPPANKAELCRNWKGALEGRSCTASHHTTNALGQLNVVCPSGFWGISKIIERQILKDLAGSDMKAGNFGLRAEPSAERPELPRIRRALFAWSEILDNAVSGTSAGLLKSLNLATRKRATAVKTWSRWVGTIARDQPGLLVLLSHTVDDALEIGRETSGERVTLAQINDRFVKKLPQDAPIVFLLGCTTGVADDQLVSFVGRFRDQGAALVVGTITPVLGERSAAVVKTVVTKLAEKRKKPVRFGELMRNARRELLLQGEFTALCATSFGDASWLVS